ncbi:hypothetical protein HWI79_543 [Cryptosporidium felis]|nr:hypothetical protein HWI79_543 [Cryptosporidium felis]
MISNLENGPTEEDLEVLLGVSSEEEKVSFVDLRDDPRKLGVELDVGFEQNNALESEIRDENSSFIENSTFNRKKLKRKNRKVKPRRKRRNHFRNDLDELSVNSDDFVVPDDEIIPPDWEYNFEKPIVCQNVTFYNKINNILTSKMRDESEDEYSKEDMEMKRMTSKHCNKSSFPTEIDLGYIDDKDKTELIVESHLAEENLDCEDHVASEEGGLETTLEELFRNSQEIKVRNLSSELTKVVKEINTNQEIPKISVSKLMELFCKKDHDCFTEIDLKGFKGERISNLLLLFKSIDLEFGNSVSKNSNRNSINLYFKSFYASLSDSIRNDSKHLNPSLLKELHFEMISFLQSKFDENLSLEKHNFNTQRFLMLLQILGLTIFVEHILVYSLKSKCEILVNRVPERTIEIFNDENLIDKSKVSKPIRQILKRSLYYILEMNFDSKSETKPEEFANILILTLFLNSKLNGDAIFTLISEYFSQNSRSPFEIITVYIYLVFAYCNVSDLKFDIDKMSFKALFDIREVSDKFQALNYLHLLNEYLKVLNVYRVNNKNSSGKFDSFLYWLSDSKLFYTVSNNTNNRMNAILEILGLGEMHFSEILKIDIFEFCSKLKNIHKNLLSIDIKIKNQLYLGFNKAINSNNIICSDNFECLNNTNIADSHLILIQEIYFNILNCLVNLLKSPNELNLLLKFIKSNFDFDKIYLISTNDIFMHFITYNSLFGILTTNSHNLEFEVPIIEIYNCYLEENDKINNFILTEMVLNENHNEVNILSAKINLNKQLKFLIEIFLGSSKFGIQFEKGFHLYLFENISVIMESFFELNGEKLEVKSLISSLSDKRFDELIEIEGEILQSRKSPNICTFHSDFLSFYSKIISGFNINFFFMHTEKVGIESLPAHGNYVDEIHNRKLDGLDMNDFKRVFLSLRVFLEIVVDNYLISLVDEIELERNKSVDIEQKVGEIFRLMENISVFLLNCMLRFDKLAISIFFRYYFRLISDRLCDYRTNFKDNKHGKKFISMLIYKSFNLLGNIIIIFRTNVFEEQNEEIYSEIYSYLIILNLLLFEMAEFLSLNHFKNLLNLKNKIFKIIIRTIEEESEVKITRRKRKATFYINKSKLTDYIIMKRTCHDLKKLYRNVKRLNIFWVNKVKFVLNLILSDEEIVFQDSSFDVSKKSELVQELFFDYYTSGLGDSEILQMFNRKIMSHSFNLFSSNNIYGLLINVIIRGMSEKSHNQLKLLEVLNWNHVNNSIKGYINQLRDDKIIKTWINYDFIQLIMIPTIFSSAFINMRINFWINIFSIPLSKMLIGDSSDYNKVRIILKYPNSYFSQLLLLVNSTIFQENLLIASINFIIEINRFIYLSFFSVISNIFETNASHEGETFSTEIQGLEKLFTKLLTTIMLISKHLITSLSDNKVNNSIYSGDENLKIQIIDNLSILNTYIIEVSKFPGLRSLKTKSTSIKELKENTLIQDIKHEIITKQNSWINCFIYSSDSKFSDKNEYINHIFNYISKRNDLFPLPLEIQRLPTIYQYVAKVISKKNNLISHTTELYSEF